MSLLQKGSGKNAKNDLAQQMADGMAKKSQVSTNLGTVLLS